MSTKLTLTIEGTIIKKAKLYASKEDRSLSDLIENYLKALTIEVNPQKKRINAKSQIIKRIL